VLKASLRDRRPVQLEVAEVGVHVDAPKIAEEHVHQQLAGAASR
jgi:hypothetical protein